MTVRYNISGLVADGDYLTGDMDAGFSQCELSSIRFFNALGQQVTPGGGTVKFSGTPDMVNYRDVDGGSFLAANAYSVSRTPPYAQGLMVKGKINLAGVTGAVTFKAVVWRI